MPRRSVHRAGLTLLELLVVLVILLALGTLLVPQLSWVGNQSQQIATRESMIRLREMLMNQYIPHMGELPRPRAELTNGGSATRQNHPQLVYLFVNPDYHENGIDGDDWTGPETFLSGRAWQGPYPLHTGMEYFVTDTDTDLATGTNFTDRYGLGNETTRVGDPTVIDAWGNPIVIQEPNANLVSGDPPTEIERRHTRLVSAGRDGILTTPPDALMPTVAERGDDIVLFLFRHDEFGDEFLTMDENR
jgi:type II secretory pathway pseudopilin PulG